jgi:pantoate--beta-alanine ligase
MKIVTDAAELVHGCAFVPTMGALHSGHQSLFKIAASHNEHVLASIFVNPLQFENAEDLEKYPRTPEKDIEMAEAAGVTHLWFPRYEELYPEGFEIISAGPLGDIYEGASRPGHFDGVVTVVSRLFELAQPQSAIFGEKDFQQLTLIRKLKSDVEIIAAPTMREIDGTSALFSQCASRFCCSSGSNSYFTCALCCFTRGEPSLCTNLNAADS